MNEHGFEFWLGVRMEDEAIQATIYDSEEKQERILDAYKKIMGVLASFLTCVGDPKII